MLIKSIGAAAAVVFFAAGLSMAQAQTPPAAPAAQPAAPAAAPAPTPATPVPAASEAKVEKPKPHLSACQRAVKTAEKALNKSTAGADTIAKAWQQISAAKKLKGKACVEAAKAAQQGL